MNLNIKNSYIIFFIIITLIATLCLFSVDNYLSPAKEIIILFASLTAGTVSIKYFMKRKSVHKTVFIIIILFGLICVFLSPLGGVSDEQEHFWRGEITSRGILFPQWISQDNVSGFESIASMWNMPRDQTIFETDWDSEKIDYTPTLINCAFQQNPFYVYIAQAIGIDLAKALDLNNIWMLWFARLANLIVYSTFCMLAIRKTPILKIPMAVVACFPLSIIQGASCSADAFIFSFTFIVIAYLLYMYKAKESSLEKKHIALFTVLVIVLGLSKVTLGGLALLILMVPAKNFKNPKDYYLGIGSIIAVLAVLGLWSKFYAVDGIAHSYRAGLFKKNHVNATEQISYILSTPQSIIPFLQIANQLPVQIDALSRVYTNYDIFPLFNYVYLAFFTIFSLLYPLYEKISTKTRIISGITVAIIILGTYIVQYLTWAPVASNNLVDAGVVPRYFLAVFVLLPLIFNINKDKYFKNKELLIITAIVCFLSSMMMFIGTMLY